MLSNATKTVEMIKRASTEAILATMPAGVYFGTVKSADPIEIEIEQKILLTQKQLVLSTLVQDFDVDMTVEHETEEYDLTHKHDIIITSPHGDTGNIRDYNGKHTHEYKGTKTFTVHLKLEAGEKVILIRVQGGQKYLVLDRVREA